MSSKDKKNNNKISKQISCIGRKRKNTKNDKVECASLIKDSNKNIVEKDNNLYHEDLGESSISAEKIKKNNISPEKLRKELEEKNAKNEKEFNQEKTKKKDCMNGKKNVTKLPRKNENIDDYEKKAESINKSDNQNSSEKIYNLNATKDTNKNRTNSIDDEFEESENSSYSEFSKKSFSENKSENINSINKIIIKRKNQTKVEDIQLEEIKKLFKENDYESLQNYYFPYMSQSEFNQKIYITNKLEFINLFFYCPICEIKLRHFSMYYHIFQFHFSYIDKYLSKRDIARACAKLMDQEYKKLNLSLELFCELAIVFSKCEFIGTNNWRINARSQINELKKLNVISQYFNKTEEEVRNELNEKLPTNINRCKNRTYKDLDLKVYLKKLNDK